MEACLLTVFASRPNSDLSLFCLQGSTVASRSDSRGRTHEKNDRFESATRSVFVLFFHESALGIHGKAGSDSPAFRSKSDIE